MTDEQQNKSDKRDDAAVDSTGSSEDGRLDRIVRETRGLTDELSEWINLKVRLIQFDVEERVNRELGDMFSGLVVVGLAALAALLALVGAAIQIGYVLDNQPLGFAVVAVFVAIVAVVVGWTRPRWGKNWLKAMKQRLPPIDEE